MCRNGGKHGIIRGVFLINGVLRIICLKVGFIWILNMLLVIFRGFKREFLFRFFIFGNLGLILMLLLFILCLLGLLYLILLPFMLCF